jgi:hypothetical protein
MIRFRRITYEQVDFIKDMSLRWDDINELKAATGLNDPWAALKNSVFQSNEWTEVAYDSDNGDIISVFGLASSEGIGVPWMVANPLIKKHKKLLMRYSKKIIQQMLKEFVLLNNFVDSRNEMHINWLKHMGFEFNGREHYLSGVKFLYFYKRREM